MVRRLRSLGTPHLIGAVVTCGAVLGIASVIHPTQSSALPAGMPKPGTPFVEREAGVSLGTLEGRGFTGTIEAAFPEARIFIDGAPLDDAYGGLTLEEFLAAEPELSGDTLDEGAEAWPEALMDVDVDSAPW
ncbi:MAG: hypothetical protein AAGH64_01875 [Planctomycetota bacterium]